jgi:hypothetical protein
MRENVMWVSGEIFTFRNFPTYCACSMNRGHLEGGEVVHAAELSYKVCVIFLLLI